MGTFEEELSQMKQVVHEGNMKVSEGIKELHSITQEELLIKDKNIVSLKLTENADNLRTLKEELSSAKENEAHTMYLLSNFKKRVHELEAEVANRRLTESRIFDLLVSETREFELTKIELEESKIEISLLHEEIKSLVASFEQNRRHCDGSCDGKIALEKELGYLRFQLGLAKANLAQIQEREKFASSKAKALSDEIHLVRNELKLANDAEEKSQKAMDDLALAFKEVATEAYKAKEKLNASQLELEQVKEEAGQLKHMIRNTEAGYQKLLDEAKKDTELHKQTADRLRLEFDESRLAEKQARLVTCIKKAEEEKAVAQDEAAKLGESLKVAERMTRAARKEIYKLRGILRQTINEANTAKAVAGIARVENIQLKDSKAEKEESIRLLTQESERLRINEVAVQENIKALKRLLSLSSLITEDKKQEEEHYVDPRIKKTSSLNIIVNSQQEQENLGAKIQHENTEKGSIFHINESPKSELHAPKHVSHHRKASSSSFSGDGGTLKTEDLCIKTEDKEQEEERYEDSQVEKTFSPNHSELKLQQEQEDLNAKIQDEDPEKAKALKGSTSDNESPKSEEEPHTLYQVPRHRGASSSSSSDDGGTQKTEGSDSYGSPRRKKKTLFRRVGDIIRRKSFNKREPST
ncbi:WEB family protein, chloroplastic-like [Capsicum galapagoense]